MSCFTEKRVAITGAASGLGKELAITYAKKGYKLALSDLNEVQGQELLNYLDALIALHRIDYEKYGLASLANLTVMSIGSSRDGVSDTAQQKLTMFPIGNRSWLG